MPIDPLGQSAAEPQCSVQTFPAFMKFAQTWLAQSALESLTAVHVAPNAPEPEPEPEPEPDPDPAASAGGASSPPQAPYENAIATKAERTTVWNRIPRS